MELFFQQIIAGISTGSIYACMALAVVMIYQTIHHINFAQGEMAMVSTFIGWQLLAWGLPYSMAFPIVILISFFGGFVMERILFKPIERAPVLTHIVVFIALFSIFNSSAGFLWDYSIRSMPSPFGVGPLFPGALISKHQAGMLGVTFAMMGLLWAFFRFTRIGLCMRAAAANPQSAKLVGIRVSMMTALGWGMASAIGACAGMLIAPVVFLEPNMMLSVLLYGFAGAVVGGLSSPLGAVLGGFVVGTIENLAATYIPIVGGELKLPIALALIVVVLLVRPAGLLGRRIVQRV